MSPRPYEKGAFSHEAGIIELQEKEQPFALGPCHVLTMAGKKKKHTKEKRNAGLIIEFCCLCQ